MGISEYIKKNEVLKSLDFVSVYYTIVELIKDKKLEWKWDGNDVCIVQSKSK